MMTEAQADTPPFAFAAPLTVCVDVKHPQAFLALGPVRGLASELGVDVDWLPFPVAPMKPPPSLKDHTHRGAQDRGARHRQIRARYQEMDLARYAAAQGLTMSESYRDDDTTLASLGTLWLRERAPDKAADYLQRVFTGFWARTLDVEQPAPLMQVMETLHEDASAFRDYAFGAGPGELAALRKRLVAAGVFAVPSLVVDGEVFAGRAHLPMARWLLTGKAGPPPI